MTHNRPGAQPADGSAIEAPIFAGESGAETTCTLASVVFLLKSVATRRRYVVDTIGWTSFAPFDGTAPSDPSSGSELS